MEKRLRSLTHPHWIDAVTSLIYRSGDRHFRWHDSGVLQSIEHLRNIVAVCQNLPRVKFWLPTREYQTVEAFRRIGGRIPSNLCVRLSTHLINGKLPLGYGLPVSTVSSPKGRVFRVLTIVQLPAKATPAADAVPVGTRKFRSSSIR